MQKGSGGAKGAEQQIEKHRRDHTTRTDPRVNVIEAPGGDGVHVTGGRDTDAVADGVVVDHLLDAAVEEASEVLNAAAVQGGGDPGKARAVAISGDQGGGFGGMAEGGGNAV